MPNADLSFLGAGLNPTGTNETLPGEDFGVPNLDTGAALVQELLSRLNTAGPNPPEKIGRLRMIIGNLGDAIQAAAAVRAGGMAPQTGQFSSGLMGRQAAYEKQKSEFEQRRIQTLEALARMQEQAEQREIANQFRASNLGLRQAMAQRPIPREFVRDVGGTPRRFRQLLDPMSGDILDEVELGPAFVPPTFLPTQQGFIEQPKTGGTGTFVPSPAGGVAMPVPPAGVVSDIAAGQATLQGLDLLLASYREIRAKTAGQSLIGQAGRMFIGETRLGGALAPDYAKYVADRRAALNSYIKSITGAQFSERELVRYEAQYPEPFDPEDVAERKLRALAQRSIADMKIKLRAFPAAAPAAPTAPGGRKSAADLADELLQEQP